MSEETTAFFRYWDALTMKQREDLADRLKTDPRYLYQIATRRRNASPQFARRLHVETGIPLKKIRPDIWGLRA